MPRKYKKLEQKTTQELVKEADKWFSKYVRLRDSELEGDEYIITCITCSKTGAVAVIEDGKLRFTKGWDAGHFISRGNKVVRFADENVNGQCAMRCNKMRSGEYEKYRLALKDKYGEEVPEELENLARTTQYYKFTKDELLTIINDSKQTLEWYATRNQANQEEKTR